MIEFDAPAMRRLRALAQVDPSRPVWILTPDLADGVVTAALYGAHCVVETTLPVLAHRDVSSSFPLDAALVLAQPDGPGTLPVPTPEGAIPPTLPPTQLVWTVRVPNLRALHACPAVGVADELALSQGTLTQSAEPVPGDLLVYVATPLVEAVAPLFGDGYVDVSAVRGLSEHPALCVMGGATVAWIAPRVVPSDVAQSKL